MKLLFDQPDLNHLPGSPYPETIDDALGFFYLVARPGTDGSVIFHYAIGRDTVGVEGLGEEEQAKLLRVMTYLEKMARGATEEMRRMLDLPNTPTCPECGRFTECHPLDPAGLEICTCTQGANCLLSRKHTP